MDIIEYSSNQDAAAQFWASDGPFESSEHVKAGNQHHVIIFATHKVRLY